LEAAAAEKELNFDDTIKAPFSSFFSVKGGDCLNSKRAALIAVLTTILIPVCFTLVYGQIASRQVIHTTGITASGSISLWQDSSCSSPLTYVDWQAANGNKPLLNDTQTAFTFWARNDGNSAVTLNYSTGNWNPIGADSYLLLTFSGVGAKLNPGTVQSETLTLTVSGYPASFNRNFSFDVTIIATYG
jgi:hypothetical protein